MPWISRTTVLECPSLSDILDVPGAILSYVADHGAFPDASSGCAQQYIGVALSWYDIERLVRRNLTSPSN